VTLIPQQQITDQNPENKEEATAKFYDISEAYETLIDPEKRSRYDLGGEEAVNGQQGGGQGGFQRGDPFETFYQFFGGQGGGFHFGGGFPGGGGFGGFQGGHHGGFQQPVKNLYDENSGVTEIGNTNDWNTHVEQRTELVLVDFYSPTCRPCIDLKDQYTSVAKSFGGYIKILAVNCQSQTGKQICQSQRIQNYPTIRLYMDEKRQVEYPSNQEKSSKSIGNWISNAMPDVTTRIDSEKKLNQFMSLGRAPVILLSDKKQVPALYKGLCRSFKTNIACGIVLNYDAARPPAYVPKSISDQVTKVPSLYYVHDSVSFAGEFFKGSMTGEILSLFFSRVVSHKSRQVSVEQLTSSRKEDCSPNDATTCVLFLSDPKSNDVASQTYAVLKKLADKYKSDPIKFFWVSPASRYVDMFSQVGASRLVAYRGKRGKYSPFEGVVSFEELNSWIDNIVTGGSALKISVARKAKHDEL
jgi:thiol-disulfide isomerase/thioredoxin